MAALSLCAILLPRPLISPRSTFWRGHTFLPGSPALLLSPPLLPEIFNLAVPGGCPAPTLRMPPVSLSLHRWPGNAPHPALSTQGSVLLFCSPSSWVGERMQLWAEENRTRHGKTREMPNLRTEGTGKMK